MDSNKSFKDLSIEEFAARLGSGSPTPGGGAAAALESALGAALIMMVANHTIGKSAYSDYEELNIDIRDKAEQLLHELLESADRDAECYGRVSQAFAQEYDDKADRQIAIAKASFYAALAPLAVMEASLSCIRLADSLIGRSNKNLVSDVYTAAISLHAGLKASRLLVEANLDAISRTAPNTSNDLRERATAILTEAEEICTNILP